ncbi:MAG: class I SAM-dependent methyltransferase [Spirochaetia bacterium]|jgi:ubiquinone/menaquinone biosynthesis C-methylase UbiE
MTHADHVALIREGTAGAGGAWADLGAGAGAFTLALASLLGESARIYAVDREAGALRNLQHEVGALFPQVQTVHADFTGAVRLPPLDGILMANSLHFHSDACAVLAHAARWLKPGGRLIIVEYDIETPNPWVPFPLPWIRLPAALECAGFSDPRLLGTRPSRYHRRVYAAECNITGAIAP